MGCLKILLFAILILSDDNPLQKKSIKFTLAMKITCIIYVFRILHCKPVPFTDKDRDENFISSLNNFKWSWDFQCFCLKYFRFLINYRLNVFTFFIILSNFVRSDLQGNFYLWHCLNYTISINRDTCNPMKLLIFTYNPLKTAVSSDEIKIKCFCLLLDGASYIFCWILKHKHGVFLLVIH